MKMIFTKQGIIEVIASTLASLYLTAYSIVKIEHIQGVNSHLVVLSMFTFILMLIHIAVLAFFKKSNTIRTISYAVIIPEIILTFEMMKWKLVLAIIGTVCIVGVIIFMIIVEVKRKANNWWNKRIKRIVIIINTQIIILSFLLVPSFVFMIITFEKYSPIAVIEMIEKTDSVNGDFSVSEVTWSKMTIEEKTKALSEIVDIENRKLDLKVIPQVEVVYLPGPIYGTTDENRLIKLNAARVSKGSASDAVDTIAHELFHCHQYDLIQSWESGGIKMTLFNSDYVDRIMQYAYENENYQSGGITDEEFEEYESQALEVDARKYAEEAVLAYVSSNN